jgi:hypothetical protein
LTISSTTRKAGPYTGNAVTTAFPFSFKVFSTSDVVVISTDTTGAETTLSLGTNYTVTLNSNQDSNPGGTVNMLIAPAVGYLLTLTSALPYLQSVLVTNGGGFYPAIFNDVFDRLTIFSQQLSDAVSRSLKISISTPEGVDSTLPSPVPYQLIGWNGTGTGFQNTDPTYSTALATDLASADKGAALIGTSQTSPSAVPYLQTVSDIINGERVSIFRFINPSLHAGLITGTDPNTDLTVSVQSAMDAADSGSFDLYIPPVKKYIRTTAPINISRPITICGGGWTPYAASVANTHGRGSWFYFDHTGIGFNVAVAANALMGSVMLEKIGTLRNQPVPGAGWTPTANDYDISVSDTDMHLRNVMLYNPTKGINQIYGNAGRLTIDGLFGQPLQVGINVDTDYDTNRFHNVHFWPFWQDNVNIHAYTKANLAAFKLLRCDNPLMTNIFSIFARYPLYFGASAAGVSSRVVISNYGFDGVGESGIFISSAATGTTAQLSNGYVYGADSTGTNAFNGVVNNSASSNINFSNLRVSQVLQQAIVNNANSIIDVSGIQVDNWNVSNAGYNAIAGSSGLIRVHGKMVLSGGNGVDAANNVSYVRSAEWLTNFTPVITAATGTITTSSSTLRYKVEDDVCTFNLTITITTNGTGAVAVKASLPIAPVQLSQIAGRESVIAGKTIVGNIPAAGLTMSINNYDNTYPGSNGAVLNISGSYQV